MECIICLQQSINLDMGFCSECLQMVEQTREDYVKHFDCEVNLIDEKIKCDKQCKKCEDET